MEEEVKQFAEVVAEDFAFDLETLALKKSSNGQIFNNIKEQLDARLEKTGKQRPRQRHQEERRERKN